MQKITIAIDGYSSTGKSTLAKQLAKALDYIYVDTGAMYRAVTLFALQQGCFGADGDRGLLLERLPEMELKFVPDHVLGRSAMYLNGKNVEEEIRTLKVSQYVSKVAAIGEVRAMLVKQQQQMGKDKGVVMDGRDIGTVVFPDAELKVFLTASLTARATRRYKELQGRGEQVTYEEVLKNVEERDVTDSTREIAPLRKAEDAVAFDNSAMSFEEQFEAVYHLALAVIAQQQ